MPGVDDGEAKEGSGRKRSGEERIRDLSGKDGEKKGERGNEGWRDRPVRSGRTRKSRVAVDAAAHEADERGRRVQGDGQKRRKPDRNARTNASCYGLPNRDAYLAGE